MSNYLNPDLMPSWLSNLFNTENHENILTNINDDDCAVMKFGDRYLVITTDFLNANPISVELGIASNYDLGRLLVLSNLSDLCGSGAKPFAMLTGITMKKYESENNFKELIQIIIT